MAEEELEIEVKEQLEQLEEAGKELAWTKYLSLATAIIAVVAAIASLASGSYSNEAVLQKNNAILFQNKASDQWNYYEAKGVKKNIADSFYTQFKSDGFKKQSVQYQIDQADIQAQAKGFEEKVAIADEASDRYLEKHHKTAFAVTFFQIAIAFAALSALLKRKTFFYGVLGLGVLGLVYLVIGVV
jgi:Tfp pilus assembly protein PilE